MPHSQAGSHNNVEPRILQEVNKILGGGLSETST